jgi:uncharacterized membrane protein YfcA
MTELAIVALASLFAGCVDAIVGGGGLVLVPALFGMYPGAAPATLLGTNKGSAHLGHGLGHSAVRATRAAALEALLPAAATALAGSFAGAWAVTLISPDGLRGAAVRAAWPCSPTRWRARTSAATTRRSTTDAAQARLASAIGSVIGFYDGFFGPGTGSFFVFLFVRLLGFDFLHASASAKLLNTATNMPRR